MSKPVDEILEALDGLGFRVWRFDQSARNEWHVVLEDTQAMPLAHHTGDADSPAGALLGALRAAGIEVSDDSA